MCGLCDISCDPRSTSTKDVGQLREENTHIASTTQAGGYRVSRHQHDIKATVAIITLQMVVKPQPIPSVWNMQKLRQVRGGVELA